MITEVDTDILGITTELFALALVNLLDARDPAVAEELVRRCTAPAGKGWKYTNDIPRRDRWSTFKPLLERTRKLEARTGASAPIKADCEDQSAAHAAAVLLLEPHRHVEVAITQPRPGAMAHAYLFVDGSPFDPCVANGMAAPPDDFYGSGETARITVVDPLFLFSQLDNLYRRAR